MERYRNFDWTEVERDIADLVTPEFHGWHQTAIESIRSVRAGEACLRFDLNHSRTTIRRERDSMKRRARTVVAIVLALVLLSWGFLTNFSMEAFGIAHVGALLFAGVACILFLDSLDSEFDRHDRELDRLEGPGAVKVIAELAADGDPIVRRILAHLMVKFDCQLSEAVVDELKNLNRIVAGIRDGYKAMLSARVSLGIMPGPEDRDRVVH